MEVSDQDVSSTPTKSTYTFSRRPKRIIRIRKALRPDRQRSISINRRQTPLNSKKIIPTNFNDDSLQVRYNKFAIDLPTFCCDFDSFHRLRVIHMFTHGMRCKLSVQPHLLNIKTLGTVIVYDLFTDHQSYLRRMH